MNMLIKLLQRTQVWAVEVRAAAVGYEESLRFGVFKANVDIIHAANNKSASYTWGVNQFADLTADEFAAQ